MTILGIAAVMVLLAVLLTALVLFLGRRRDEHWGIDDWRLFEHEDHYAGRHRR